MPDVLIYGAPNGAPDLFHAIPAGIVDPFLYVERDGRRVATVSVLDADKVSALGIEVLDGATLGRDELLEQGLTDTQLEGELALRACRKLGVSSGIVPPDFPLGVADALRAGGLELTVDEDGFVRRRRAKTDHQLAGI